MASVIWQDSEKRWSLRVQLHGVQKRFTSSKPGIAGKKEVLKKYRDFTSGGSAENLFVSEAWERFLSYIEDKNGKGEAYINLEKYGRLYILPRVGKKLLNTINIIDLQDCISKARRHSGGDGPLSRRTLRNLKATIMQFVRWAESLGLMDPLRGQLYVPKSAPNNEKVILQPSDISRLFEGPAGSDWYINIFRFACVTGLRPGEILGIQRQDLDGNVLTINRAINCRNKITEGKNKNARRQIYLNSFAHSIIAENLSRNATLFTDWIFCSKVGGPLSQSTLRNNWIRIAQERNLPGNIYSLRHTFISMLKNDMPAEMLKSIVGHSASMDTFGVYGHQVDGEMQSAAKIIDINFAKITHIEQLNENSLSGTLQKIREGYRVSWWSKS